MIWLTEYFWSIVQLELVFISICPCPLRWSDILSLLCIIDCVCCLWILLLPAFLIWLHSPPLSQFDFPTGINKSWDSLHIFLCFVSFFFVLPPSEIVCLFRANSRRPPSIYLSLSWTVTVCSELSPPSPRFSLSLSLSCCVFGVSVSRPICFSVTHCLFLLTLHLYLDPGVSCHPSSLQTYLTLLLKHTHKHTFKTMQRRKY